MIPRYPFLLCWRTKVSRHNLVAAYFLFPSTTSHNGPTQGQHLVCPFLIFYPFERYRSVNGTIPATWSHSHTKPKFKRGIPQKSS
ncbi:hypothetical protein CDAR_55171 [Caerostris darwini]|uniref:Secreted protein n=1 Tax=Caerostris darwini TaxID=1538125 RepID=A0AAV4PF02_9ARAC|nr:hypothetical protein CDAR_55171 [Caerostris darwini]